MSSPKRRTVSAMPWSFSDVLTEAKMHYYQWNIGDYATHTTHLDPLEDIAFRRMLDWLYLHEKPLPIPVDDIARFIRMREHEVVIRDVLNEFFIRQDNGWINERVLDEIAKYHSKSEQASRAGKASAQRKANGRSTDVQPTINQEPLTNNHIVDNTTDVVSPPKVRRNGTRLSADWTLPKQWSDWAKQERPDLNAQSVGDQFKDFWISKAGAGATKLDWQATWRNWVRSQKAPRLNPADAVRTTVPSTTERDPTLVRLEEERKNWKPPAPEVLAKMQALKGKVFGANDNVKEIQ